MLSIDGKDDGEDDGEDDEDADDEHDEDDIDLVIVPMMKRSTKVKGGETKLL